MHPQFFLLENYSEQFLRNHDRSSDLFKLIKQDIPIHSIPRDARYGWVSVMLQTKSPRCRKGLTYLTSNEYPRSTIKIKFL